MFRDAGGNEGAQQAVAAPLVLRARVWGTLPHMIMMAIGVVLLVAAGATARALRRV